MIPTHAGGIVARDPGAGVRFLLVRARREPRGWIFPKGHIEANETPEAAAVREVAEEGASEAVILEELDTIEFADRRGDQVVRFYLMEFVAPAGPGEGRETAWLAADEVYERLRFDEARALFEKAVARLQARTGRPENESSHRRAGD